MKFSVQTISKLKIFLIVTQKLWKFLENHADSSGCIQTRAYDNNSNSNKSSNNIL